MFINHLGIYDCLNFYIYEIRWLNLTLITILNNLNKNLNKKGDKVESTLIAIRIESRSKSSTFNVESTYQLIK